MSNNNAPNTPKISFFSWRDGLAASVANAIFIFIWIVLGHPIEDVPSWWWIPTTLIFFVIRGQFSAKPKLTESEPLEQVSEHSGSVNPSQLRAAKEIENSTNVKGKNRSTNVKFITFPFLLWLGNFVPLLVGKAKHSAHMPALEVIFSVIVTAGEYTLLYFALCVWKSLVQKKNLRGIKLFRIFSFLLVIGISIFIIYNLRLREEEGPMMLYQVPCVVAELATFLLIIVVLFYLAFRAFKAIAHVSSPTPPQTVLEWWSAASPRKRFLLTVTVAIILIVLFTYIFSQNLVGSGT